MSERAKFVLEREHRRRAGRGRVEVAALCRQYGVRSRQTGYVWIRRYQDAGHDVSGSTLTLILVGGSHSTQ